MISSTRLAVEEGAEAAVAAVVAVDRAVAVVPLEVRPPAALLPVVPLATPLRVAAPLPMAAVHTTPPTPAPRQLPLQPHLRLQQFNLLPPPLLPYLPPLILYHHRRRVITTQTLLNSPRMTTMMKDSSRIFILAKTLTQKVIVPLKLTPPQHLTFVIYLGFIFHLVVASIRRVPIGLAN